jgi:hypothetical protein
MKKIWKLLSIGAVLTFLLSGCKKDEDVVVTTYPVTEVGVSTVTCGGDVIVNLSGISLTELGVCWSTSKNPTISDDHVSTPDYNDCFVCTLRDLQPNTKYHVRAYALRGTQPYYGKDVSFKTENFEGMTILTDTVTNITYSSARCGGVIEDDGGMTLISWGLCWSQSTSPTINDNKLEINLNQNTFFGNLINLSPETTYYVRAFATNSIGTFYGNQVTFRTLDGRPAVHSVNINSVTTNTARFIGEVTDGGMSYVTERGFCWSTNHNPTIIDEKVVQGTGTGQFSSIVNSLLPGTVYYVKAYAQNAEGIGYGDELSFMTLNNAPIVITNGVSDIDQTSAKGDGEVVNSGGLSVIERGFCWSTTPSPTINDNQVAYGSGLGQFWGNMTNLTPRTKYYFRAYAKNDLGVGYGDIISFTTIDLPTVVTTDAINIQATSFVASGNVTDDGGVPLTSKGMCWGVTPNPTITGSHTSDGDQIGEFTSNITNLNLNTTYYIRAYATNSLGTSYGQQIVVKTKDGVALISTHEISSIMATSATCGGSISDDGGFPITSRGICWSTMQNPTINNNHTTDGSGDGSFTSIMNGLSLNTVYYVRAYAINAHGTYYGEQRIFTTKDGIAIVSTMDITNINKTTASSGGTITTDGGSPIVAKGVCWSVNDNPTISNNHSEDGTGISSYNSNIFGLQNGTYYYVRAYVTNAYGTYYGESKKFLTHPIGAVGGLFSVSATKKVFISQGNLQYQASTNTWRFATHQYDLIGLDNLQASQDYSGWIDIFNYGTSGYNEKYPYNYYDYANCCIENTYYDWGVFNAINNGGNQNGVWRTITKEEWQYLLFNRPNASAKRSSVTVNNIPGYIILPDLWDCPHISFIPNANNYITNVYSLSQWEEMNKAGAVFLPAAGYKTSVGYSYPHMLEIGVSGWYFSTAFRTTPAPYANYFTYVFRFDGQAFEVNEYSYMHIGYGPTNFSIRLVQDY